MKVYCDTSVLVAASVSAPSPPCPVPGATQADSRGKARGGYQRARHPRNLRSSYPGSADSTRSTRVRLGACLRKTSCPIFRWPHISASQYTSVLRQAAEKGWTGGLVYDALHLAAATSNHCKRIYTFNLRHFLQLAPRLQDAICSRSS